MKSGKASGVRCPACNGYCKGYPVKCRHCGRRFGKELTPAKSCLDRGRDHRVKMATHELHTHRSTFATELQIPKLAPTGEVVVAYPLRS